MGEQLRRAMTVTIRGMALALAIIFVMSIATGWLYWARGAVAGWPGPHVTDALPLDELAGHDSVPLIVYLAAFGMGGVALGLLARALRFDRLRAGLFLACGVGTWLLLADAFSLVIVRQVPAGQAIRSWAGTCDPTICRCWPGWWRPGAWSISCQHSSRAPRSRLG